MEKEIKINEIEYRGELAIYAKYIDFLLKNLVKEEFNNWKKEQENHIKIEAKNKGYEDISMFFVCVDGGTNTCIYIDVFGKEEKFGNIFRSKKWFDLPYTYIYNEFGLISRIQKTGWDAELQPEVYMICTEIETKLLQIENQKLKQIIKHFKRDEENDEDDFSK